MLGLTVADQSGTLWGLNGFPVSFRLFSATVLPFFLFWRGHSPNIAFQFINKNFF